MDEKMRAEFEAWLNSQGLESKWKPERNAYEHFVAHFAYRAWVDSRAALVIELPERITKESGYSEDDEYYNLALKHCQHQIEAAGVRVKP